MSGERREKSSEEKGEHMTKTEKTCPECRVCVPGKNFDTDEECCLLCGEPLVEIFIAEIVEECDHED